MRVKLGVGSTIQSHTVQPQNRRTTTNLGKDCANDGRQVFEYVGGIGGGSCRLVLLWLLALLGAGGNWGLDGSSGRRGRRRLLGRGGWCHGVLERRDAVIWYVS